MKHILVTGASGYIGAHLCKLLKEHGYRVTGWDKEIYPTHNTLYIDTYRVVDINNAVLYGQFDAIVHLAGMTRVGQSMFQPSLYYHVNTRGTNNVIEQLATDHFIFASTSSAFEMKSPYARSKVAAEDIIKEKAKRYTIFRFFNVSGTDGVNHQIGPATHLIRRAAEVATDKRDFVEIYGTNYPTKDGTCIRDYVHVLDVCNAIINSIERGAVNTPYECLGSNVGYSVYDVIETMRKVTGHKIPIIESPPRDGDAVSSIVDKLSPLITLKYTLEDMCLSQFKYESIS